MNGSLYLAPAGHGKTEHVIQRIRAAQKADPLTPIYAIFPNQNQVHAFRARLSADQGAIGVTLGTFYTFYAHILGLAGRLQPSMPEPVQYRLLRQAVEQLADQGTLQHFADLRDKPGFVVVLRTLVEEFKRASIGRDEFVKALDQLENSEPRLAELGEIYTYYQDWLLENGWADTEGQGWLAALALRRDKTLCDDLQLLVVDGFDEFTPNQLEVLGLLTERATDTVVTMTGEVAPDGQVRHRPAWRRFHRALRHVQQTLEIEPQPLPIPSPKVVPMTRDPHLRLLEENLFEGHASQATDDAQIGDVVSTEPTVQLTEAQNRSEEARAALRWIKARLVQDGMAPHQVAIIGRDIGPYRLFLEETAREFGIPIHVGEGLRLATNPAVAALLSLLMLPLESSQDDGFWARRPVLDVLRNPYLQDVAPNIVGRDVLRLEWIATKAHVVRGLDQWQDALTDWVGYIERKVEEASDQENGAEAAEAQQERDDDVEEGSTGAQIDPAEASALQSAFMEFSQRIMPSGLSSPREYAAFVESIIGDEPAQSQINVADELALNKETEPLGIASRAALNVDTAARDLAALRVLKEILRSMILASDSFFGEAQENNDSGNEPEPQSDIQPSYEQFILDLTGSVQGAVYYPPSTEGASMTSAVPVLSVLNARGLAYRAVAIIGLAEGDFPRGEREDILLREEDRAQLRQAGLDNLDTRLHGDEISFFYQAVTRATAKLLLTRPYLADDGEAWEPSPYWQEVVRLLQPDIAHIRPEDPLRPDAVSSPNELMRLLSQQKWTTEDDSGIKHRWIAEAELANLSPPEIERVLRNAAILHARLAEQPRGIFEGDLARVAAHLTTRYSADHVWSSSRLEAYGLCPLHFWLGQDLMLEARQPPQEGFDVFILGNMYHEILEEIYEQVETPATPDALLAFLPEIAEEVFDAAPQKYGFRPSPLWAMQRNELEQIMARTLAALGEATADLVPMKQEQVFGLEGALPLTVERDGDAFRVRGFIDRIDQDADGKLHIIDYKSGSSAIRAADLEEGRRLQIALYALAAQNALKLGTIGNGFYWHVGSAKASSLALNKFDGGVEAALEKVIEHTFAHVQGVRAGHFEPTPPSSGCPGHCPGASFCWRYKPKSF